MALVLSSHENACGGSVVLNGADGGVAEQFARESEEADIVRRWVTLDEAVDAVLAGRVRNGIFQAAVLAEHARRSRG